LEFLGGIMFSKALALAAVTIFGGTIAAVGCSSSSTGTGTGDDTTPDAMTTTHDAAPDHAVTGQDAETFDTSTGDTGTGATCAAAPLTDASTMLIALPTMAKMDICGSGDVTAAIAACFGASATTTTCMTWEPGGTGTATQQMCGACIFGNTSGTTTTVGISLNLGNTEYATANTAGCVEDLDTSAAGQTCAADLWALDSCELGVCASCDDTDDPQGTMVSTCYMTADQGACASLVNTADTDCAATLQDGGAASVCDPSLYSTASAAFLAFGAAMCGGS
jgi:hypothetical protein